MTVAVRCGSPQHQRRKAKPPVDQQRYAQLDHEYGAVYTSALKLQHECEKAGMVTQAAQAREIRRQVHIRMLALHATRKIARER